MKISELPLDEQAYINEVYGNYINGEFYNRETGEVLTVEAFNKWMEREHEKVNFIDDCSICY